MPRIQPLSIEDLAPPERQAVERAEAMMGFVANDALTMARNPELMHAFAGLVGAIYKPSAIDNGLKRLIGLISSSAAGCEYCMGHTAFTSEKFGVPNEKLDAVWTFETSDAFSEAERAALRVALHGGQTPNGVTDEMFKDLATHFDDVQQMEIVSVIALFGFLNRWNATLATELEGLPGAALARIKS